MDPKQPIRHKEYIRLYLQRYLDILHDLEYHSDNVVFEADIRHKLNKELIESDFIQPLRNEFEK